MCDVGLHAVFAPFWGPSSVSFTKAKFAIKELPGDSIVLHSSDVSCPSKVGF